MDLWAKFGEMGLLGLTASEDYGGMGRSYLDHVLVMEEVSSLVLNCAGQAREGLTGYSGIWAC